jgi:predicted nucleic acid-binding protein
VVVDTGVYAARFGRAGHSLAFAYRDVLAERKVVVSFITVAELRFGAELAAWGARRLRIVEEQLRKVEVVWPGPRLVRSYASLRAWCVRHGHGLGQKEHEADRWVAATAVMLGVPLVAHDGIFRDVEGLDLVTRLG